MINVNSTYNSIMANGGHYEWQIINGSNTIKGDLKEGTVSQKCFEQCSIGNVIASELDFSFYGSTIDPSSPLKLQFRAVSGSSASPWYNRETYYIDTIDKSPYSDVAKIKAYDSLMKGNAVWMPSGTFTATTDRLIVEDIADRIGVGIEPNTQSILSNAITIDKAPSIGTNGTTMIEMLSYIGVLRGGNWIIDNSNKLKLIPLFSESQTASVGDAVDDFDASPGEPIVGVCIWASENEYYRVPNVDDATWAALDGRIIEAKCFIGGSQALAQSLYNSFNGHTYYPYTTNKAWVDLKYELGDAITIKDVTSTICNQTINLTALGSCSLEADGLDRVTSHYPTPTPTERQIAQTKQDIVQIVLRENSIEATVADMETNLQTQITQNANGVTVLTQYQNDQESYMQYDGTIPALKIGVSGSSVHTEITDGEFKIVDGVEESTFSQGKLTTNIVHAETETQTGRWAWVDEGVDGFSLIFME